MWFWFQLSGKYDYDTVKNHWLSSFETKDKDIGEGEFYIKLESLDDIIEVTNLIGEDITVGTFCDEPTISV
jgi:hypothetical protein